MTGVIWGWACGPLQLRHLLPDSQRASNHLAPTFRGGGLAFWFGARGVALALVGGTVSPCLSTLWVHVLRQHGAAGRTTLLPGSVLGHGPFVPELAGQGQFCPLLSPGL